MLASQLPRRPCRCGPRSQQHPRPRPLCPVRPLGFCSKSTGSAPLWGQTEVTTQTGLSSWVTRRGQRALKQEHPRLLPPTNSIANPVSPSSPAFFRQPTVHRGSSITSKQENRLSLDTSQAVQPPTSASLALTGAAVLLVWFMMMDGWAIGTGIDRSYILQPEPEVHTCWGSRPWSQS